MNKLPSTLSWKNSSSDKMWTELMKWPLMKGCKRKVKNKQSSIEYTKKHMTSSMKNPTSLMISKIRLLTTNRELLKKQILARLKSYRSLSLNSLNKPLRSKEKWLKQKLDSKNSRQNKT